MSLQLLAHAHAVAAENALVRGRGRWRGWCCPWQSAGGYPGSGRAARRSAGPAPAGGSCRSCRRWCSSQSCEASSSSRIRRRWLQQAGGVGADLQPVARLHGAGGVDLAGLHVLDDAHAARAVDGELGIVAEGGHVDSGLPDDGQDVLLAVERHAQPVDNHCSLGHDLTLLFNGVDGAEGTCAPARAAVDAFFRVDGVRHADLTVDGARRDSCAGTCRSPCTAPD